MIVKVLSTGGILLTVNSNHFKATTTEKKHQDPNQPTTLEPDPGFR